MLTTPRKLALQEEGYAARQEGAACPYEEHSDEWHHWQTGWLLHRCEEEAADDGPPAPQSPPDLPVQEPPPGAAAVLPPPPADDAESAQGIVCPACGETLWVLAPAACPWLPPGQRK
ncbi:MAG TPA: hypothetical protein VI298_14415 [Geobacteraceae bacterium]